MTEPMSDRDFKAAVEHLIQTELRASLEPRSHLRFDVGDMVMCNLGQDGWKLGRVIALHYREEHWPSGQVAPYQVALEGDHDLIFVPSEDTRYCREATRADMNIERRLDTLAPPPPGLAAEREVEGTAESKPAAQLSRDRGSDCVSVYRNGRCHGCCPGCWSSVELYSEHYRAALRNRLKITWRTADLGTLRLGASVDIPPLSSQRRASCSAPRCRGCLPASHAPTTAPSAGPCASTRTEPSRTRSSSWR
jgi:hypothetical protein